MKFARNIKSISLILVAFGTLSYTGVRYYIENFATRITIWGQDIEYREFIPIINSGVMQRLKQIDQAGPARYLGPALPAFSRYDHSLGVFMLLKKTGASKKELAAGLLHDASHTVFSHVGDYIWAKNINEYSQSSFQDKIHLSYLKRNRIDQVLSKLGISLADVDVEKNNSPALEQELPDMCADRIQYNLHTGILFGLINDQDSCEIVNDLNFENGKWFFRTPALARKFANLSLYFTQNFWGSKWNTSMNIHFANALKRALTLKIISTKDLFSTDRIVMNKLVKNQDLVIQLNLQQCQQPTDKIAGQKYRTEKYTPKFRGVDPLVKVDDNGFVRLSEIDSEFKNNYDSVKKWCKDGFEVDILVP